jgi:undecaprenyl-phosphate galactose phosphotransferase
MKKDADDELDKILENPELKAEFQKDYKLKNDPRITRVGKVIRKLSIDELPQFLNVLFGNMSLVGPRPIVEGETDKYGNYINKRHIIKPGVTGMWQVSGRNEVAYDERIRLDSYYIENWSFWLDLSIIFKTFFAIFKKNAY